MMTEEEANTYCDAYLERVRQNGGNPLFISIAGINKMMDSFVRSSYFKALKNK